MGDRNGQSTRRRGLPHGFAGALLLSLALPLAALAGEQKSAFNHTPPTDARPNEPLTLEGNLAGAGDFDKLLVRVKNAAGDFDDFKLELQYGDLYRVQLPASYVSAPGLDYYVEGVTAAGERVALFASGSRLVHVTVGAGGARDKPAPKEPKEQEPAAEPEKEAQTLEAVQAALAKKCKRNKKTPQCRDLLQKEKDLKDEQRRAKEAAREAKEREDKERAEKDRADKAEKDRAEREGAEKDKAEKDRHRDQPRDGKPKAEVPRTRSELEEELAIYAAEEPAGLVQRVEDTSRQAPHPPTVLTARQLRQLGVRYVYEALDLVPGLSVSRDLQGNWRVAVRGLRAEPEVLFLLNGQALNDFYDGRALANLPVDTLERLEVYRGPATADVGLGNFLALVNLVTNRADGLRASASGGSHDAFDGHLSAARTFGPVKVFLDGEVAYQFGDRKPVPKDGLDTATSVRPKSTSDRRLLVNAGGGLSYESAALGKLTASGRFLFENRSALLGLFDTVGSASNLEWLVWQAAVEWERPLSELGTLSARLWFDQQNTNRLWQLAPEGFQARATDPATLFPEGILENVRTTTRSFGLDARGAFPLPFNNRLVAGLSAELRTLGAYDYLTNYVAAGNTYAGPALKRPDGLLYPTEDGKNGRGPAADRFGLGLFVFDTWTPNEVISVQAGARLDLVQVPTADATGWTGKAFAPGVGPRVGLSVSPWSSLVFRGSYGRSFRAPTVQQYAETIPNSDSNQGRFVGNPQLAPANIDTVEAGVEYLQGVGEGKLRLRGQAFFDRVSNAIAQIDTSGNLVPYSNRPLGVQAVGAEGEARLELTRRFTAWLNASWVRAEDLGTPAQARLLTDVPQVRANAGLSLPLGPWLNLDVTSRFASERRNDSRSVLELIRRYTLPGYATFGAQLRTELLFDRLELAVTGQNVFNFEYADDATRPDRVTGGVPREGWLVFGNVRLEL